MPSTKPANITLFGTEKFLTEVRGLSDVLNVDHATMLRTAALKRLSEPPRIDLAWREEGMRTDTLKVHFDPELRSAVRAAAKAEGKSISGWLEAAVGTHLIQLLQVGAKDAAEEAKEAEDRAVWLRNAARVFREHLTGRERESSGQAAE